MSAHFEGCRFSIVLLASVVFSALLAFGAVSWAHGGAEVSAYPTTVAPGERLFVQGGDINPGGPIALFLEGLKGKIRLGQVQGDEDGGFKASLAIPPDVAPGTYLLRAVGANGTSATFEVQIAPAGNPVTQEPREATDAFLALERPQPLVNWPAILLIALSLLVGARLLRPERPTPRTPTAEKG